MMFSILFVLLTCVTSSLGQTNTGGELTEESELLPHFCN